MRLCSTNWGSCTRTTLSKRQTYWILLLKYAEVVSMKNLSRRIELFISGCIQRHFVLTNAIAVLFNERIGYWIHLKSSQNASCVVVLLMIHTSSKAWYMGTMNSAQRDALSSMEGKSTRQTGLRRTMESTAQMKRWRKHGNHSCPIMV